MDERLVQEVTSLVMQRLSIPVGVSARHVHLTQENVELLFGKGHTLKPVKELMGGQYAAAECVTIIGEKLRPIENVRILGPTRKFSQVEVSRTDAVRLGINPPLRDSGDIKGSAAISIVGPKGVIYLSEGCIIAKRHIHMNRSDAQFYSVEDGQRVRVRYKSERGGIFDEVLIRVDDSFTLEMHIDVDEANSLGISNTDGIVIVK